jgi:hypothetical protein
MMISDGATLREVVIRTPPKVILNQTRLLYRITFGAQLSTLYTHRSFPLKFRRCGKPLSAYISLFKEKVTRFSGNEIGHRFRNRSWPPPASNWSATNNDRQFQKALSRMIGSIGNMLGGRGRTRVRGR